jgi:hypothetical protein
VGEVIRVGSLRPIRTAQKIWEAAPSNAHHGGGFMPTAETTLNPASGINQRAAKRSLTSDARLDNELNFGHGKRSFRET